MLNAMIVLDTTKEVKIVAWKYDECFDACLIKRVNAICDAYHYYSSIINLPVQDLKELYRIPLLNPSKPARVEDFVKLLNAGLSRMPSFVQTRCDQEDDVFSTKKRTKKRAKAELDGKYLLDFSDKDFEKVTSPGLKVIDGTQSSKQILKCFFHEATCELKLVRDLDDWDNEKISFFSVLVTFTF